MIKERERPNTHTHTHHLSSSKSLVVVMSSSEPSFEAACRTLEGMFPDLDPIVVRSVLDAKDGNVNEATTKLLAMSRSKRGGGGMSSSSGGGGGGGYGDAPRSESMGGNGGEEINPYTKDARYDDARAL